MNVTCVVLLQMFSSLVRMLMSPTSKPAIMPVSKMMVRHMLAGGKTIPSVTVTIPAQSTTVEALLHHQQAEFILPVAAWESFLRTPAIITAMITNLYLIFPCSRLIQEEESIAGVLLGQVVRMKFLPLPAPAKALAKSPAQALAQAVATN